MLLSIFFLNYFPLLILALGMVSERDGAIQKVGWKAKGSELLFKKEHDSNSNRSGNPGRNAGIGSKDSSMRAVVRASAKSTSERKKMQAKGSGGGGRNFGDKVAAQPQRDVACTNMGGICQRNTYVCQGRYLRHKCAGSPGRQCCMPAGAWAAFCANHQHNRIRHCDGFGCGAFGAIRPSERLHKGVDIVCEDYSNVKAPFTGTLGGPLGRRGPTGIQFDGVKLSNAVHCVKIFNVRPHRYTGPISQGETLGYLLPLQDHLSGITSHLELQMCDMSDPTPFI